MADKDETDTKTDEKPDLDLDKIDDEANKLLNDEGGKKKDDDDEDDPEGADQLGDAGKRALERMKAGRSAAREERDQIKKEYDRVQAELKKHSDKDKSETQRLQEERDELKKALDSERTTRQKREAAEEYAPDDAPTKLIRAAGNYITGTTDEELKASAEQFYALFADRPSTKKEQVGPPKEKLRGGGNSTDDEPDETDPRKLAAMIRRAQ